MHITHSCSVNFFTEFGFYTTQINQSNNTKKNSSFFSKYLNEITEMRWLINPSNRQVLKQTYSLKSCLVSLSTECNQVFLFILIFIFLSPIHTVQTRKKVSKIRNESSKCYLSWCWSFSFHGRHCMWSIRLHCSIRKWSIKRLAIRLSPIFNCWHILQVAVIQSHIVLWIEDSGRHVWIYFGVANDSSKPGGSASVAAQSVLLKAVKSHSYTEYGHSRKRPTMQRRHRLNH